MVPVFRVVPRPPSSTKGPLPRFHQEAEQLGVRPLHPGGGPPLRCVAYLLIGLHRRAVRVRLRRRRGAGTFQGAGSAAPLSVKQVDTNPFVDPRTKRSWTQRVVDVSALLKSRPEPRPPRRGGGTGRREMELRSGQWVRGPPRAGAKRARHERRCAPATAGYARRDASWASCFPRGPGAGGSGPRWTKGPRRGRGPVVGRRRFLN